MAEVLWVGSLAYSTKGIKQRCELYFSRFLALNTRAWSFPNVAEIPCCHKNYSSFAGLMLKRDLTFCFRQK